MAQTKSRFGFGSKSHKTVTTTVEYHWNYSVAYELLAFRGASAASADDRVLLCGHEGHCRAVTSVEETPRPKVAQGVTADGWYSSDVLSWSPTRCSSFFCLRSRCARVKT